MRCSSRNLTGGWSTGALLAVVFVPALGSVMRAQEVRAQEVRTLEERTLEEPQAVEDLCGQLALREQQGAPPGDPVSRGWLKARQDARRDAALAGLYRVTLRAEEFHFDDYQPESSRLPLHLADGLALFGGRVLLVPSGEKAHLLLGMQDAKGLVEQHSSQNLRLVLDFQLDASRGGADVCDHEEEITGRRVRRLRVIPQHYRWTDVEGRVIASALGEADDPVAEEQVSRLLQQAKVRLDLARVLAADPPPPVGVPLEAVLGPLLLPCLRERIALLRKPVEGSLVVELFCVGGGKENEVVVRRRLMDDEPLISCTARRLARAELPAAAGCGRHRLSVPIFFQSASFR
ncbi:MAG: hypothetical protein FJ125_16530 [Deltaproteobacteria bacterium]|nr:hypothetical protein [Deltaproteobacteria bacterium]